MKILTFCILFINFIISVNYLFSQDTKADYHIKYEEQTNSQPPEYSSPTEFLTEHIVSDYGKRHVPDGLSKWHRGVDFNNGASPSRWDHILSLNKGFIMKIGEASNYGYKWIITFGSELYEQHNFGYGHIFTDGSIPAGMKKGDLVLKKMDSPNDDYYAIINLTNSSAIGGQGLTQVTYQGTIYNCTSVVENDGIIGVIGNSGGYNYKHVHVYMFYDINQAIQNHNNIFNDRDPLQYISHDNTSYILNIGLDNNVNDDNIIISSGSTAISIKVRFIMDDAQLSGSHFTNVVMDIDDIDIYIKRSYLGNEYWLLWGNPNSNYQLITGEWVKSHLSHGGRFNSEVYPVTANYNHNANPPSNTVINIAGNTYGDFTHTGINPFAYRSIGNEAYDEYYFSDFYTRVVNN